MKITQSAKNVLGVIATVTLLIGCSNGTNSQLAPTAGAQGSALNAPKSDTTLQQLVSVASPKVRVQPRLVNGTHPIKPNCCASVKTLFISDSGAFAVQLFDFPSNTYIGELAGPPEGFADPQGMCSDNKGDVYIANTLASTIDEFAHDGTYIRTLSDPGQYPAGCAFDPSTGNLAVSNIVSTDVGYGSLSIYANATGTPALYSSAGFGKIFFVGYMGKTGVLYLDGQDRSVETTVYGSFSGGTITPIPIIGGTISFPGAVAYSAKTRSMNIGDQNGATLYQISTAGVITGSTPLMGSGDVDQGTIKGGRFIGPDTTTQSVEIYAYPAGGEPQSTIAGYFYTPIGSAVSPDNGN
jgi:hypothetical protein